MRVTRNLAFAACCCVVAVAPLPASAHHSTAEFNYAKTVILKGTVKELQWTNPHSYIQMIVAKPDGALDQWGVEIGAPAINVRLGWRKSSVKPGDKVTMDIAPARNGSNYGTLRTLTFADGRVLHGVASSVKSDKDGNATLK